MGRRRKHPKAVASQKAIDYAHPQVVDWKRKATEQFIKTFQKKKMFLRINQDYFLRVRVLKINKSLGLFEDVMIKILEIPEWISRSPGTYKSIEENYKNWKQIKKFDKIFVNHLSLYNSSQAKKIVEEQMNVLLSNKLAVVSRLKFIKQNISDLEILKERINKLVKL